MTSPSGEVKEGLFEFGIFVCYGTEEDIRKGIHKKNRDQLKQVQYSGSLDKQKEQFEREKREQLEKLNRLKFELQEKNSLEFERVETKETKQTPLMKEPSVPLKDEQLQTDLRDQMKKDLQTLDKKLKLQKDYILSQKDSQEKY